MVRKVIVIFALIALFVVPASAAGYPGSTADSSWSYSYNSYFSGLAGEILFDDYLFYRCNERDYCLVAGDLEVTSGGKIYGEDLNYWIYSLSNNYGSSSAFYRGSVDSLTVDVGDHFVYSNLPGFCRFPFDNNQFVLIVGLAVCFLFLVVSKVLR